jgi:hypothetical protein
MSQRYTRFTHIQIYFNKKLKIKNPRNYKNRGLPKPLNSNNMK